MRNPLRQTEAAIDSANIRIQQTLDRVEGAATVATIAFAVVAVVAVSALLLAASLVEAR